jgi:hypothetical protein
MKNEDLLLEINKAAEFFNYFGQFRPADPKEEATIFFTFYERKEIPDPRNNDLVKISTIPKPEAEPEMALKFYKALWEKNKVVYNNREVEFAMDQIKKVEGFDEKLKIEYHDKLTNFKTLLLNVIENGGSKITELNNSFKLLHPGHTALKDVYSALKNAGLIKCELKEFKKIFSGGPISEKDKVEWIGNANSLIHFVKELYNKVLKVEKVDWKVASHSFSFRTGNLANKSFRDNNKSHPKKEIKSQIDAAIKHFLAAYR